MDETPDMQSEQPEKSQQEPAQALNTEEAVDNSETSEVDELDSATEIAEPELDEEAKARARKLGLELKGVWERDISADDILFILNTFPFLQIVSSNASHILPKRRFIAAQSGWTIYDYGDALTASPGWLLFRGGDYRIDNLPVDLQELHDGDKNPYTEFNAGKGSVIKQTVDTAAEMIYVAIKRKWAGANVVDGHPLMMWAAWMMAEDQDFQLHGYRPSEQDWAKRRILRRTGEEVDEVRMRIKAAEKKAEEERGAA